MEINKAELMNPLAQDIKKDKLRYVNNVYPFYGYIWNYGALPQTYDDPNVIDKTTGCVGDNDPLDVIELGSLKQVQGNVIQIKVSFFISILNDFIIKALKFI
jgi:inorganic pyrophosphatase